MKWLEKFKVMPGRKVLEESANILLRHHRMPGDTIAMTPLVRDIKRTYGAQVNICVYTPQAQGVWVNNPNVCDDDIEITHQYDLDYKISAEEQDRGLHMSEGFREDFMRQSGLHLNASTMWPDIYLSDEEIESFESKFPSLKRYEYWVICPGNKSSNRLKVWPKVRWQKFLKSESSNMTFVQIGQGMHNHRRIHSSVVNMIDCTPSLRDLFLLIYFSRGTIGYHSLHMHIAAAFRKPCIVIGGAREPLSFYKYPNHQVISTMGLVPCGMYKGCFRSTKGLGVRDICSEWKNIHGEDIPACMVSIEVNDVRKAYNSYEKLYSSKKILFSEIASCVGRNEADSAEDIKSQSIIRLKNDKKEVMPEGNGKISKGIFRMLCNARCFGGGERTAIRIMALMQDEGYEVEFVALNTPHISAEFLMACPKGIKQVGEMYTEKCDIACFHVNDALLVRKKYQYSPNDPIVDHHFSLAKRTVVSVNYSAIYLDKYIDADCFIFQSKELRQTFYQNILPSQNWTQDLMLELYDKCHVLKPPADLSRFLDIEYNRDWSKLRLIRHSSQGDHKYYDDINEQISKIYEINPEVEIHFMPAPSFLDKRFPIACYPYNAVPVEQFLAFGNVFWYFVPPEKFIEAGANVVLEAMAAGLPVLCNDNGGLKDIVQSHVGHCCKTFDEIYEQVGLTEMDSWKIMGQNARDYVRELVDPRKWVECMTGEFT